MKSSTWPALLVFLAAGLSLNAAETNLARLGHATAGSIWHNLPAMAPAMGIDGNSRTRWSAEGRHAWFQIEWPTPQTIRGAVIRNYDESWNKNIPFTCQIWDASLNGGKGEFRTLQTTVGYTSTVGFQFPEVTTTKLRVTNVITFWELEVYNDAQILNRIIGNPGKISIAVAGDVRGNMVGSLSRGEGAVPVVHGRLSVDGHAPHGVWHREATTDEAGLFSVPIPNGLDSISVAAEDADDKACLKLQRGDLALCLTPQPSARDNYLSLDGQWDFSPGTNGQAWTRVRVPSHWEMEGLVAKEGEAIYRRTFTLPKHWRGRIKFRAEGIYSKAEVWINGRRLGSHDGTATPFEMDATSAVQPGANNVIQIVVADHSDAEYFSAMSFYAHMNLGGIWRSLGLFCVPEAHLNRLTVETDFDAQYRDAVLRLDVDAVNEQDKSIEGARLTARLFDPRGREIALDGLQTNFSFAGWQNQPFTLSATVRAPEKWSAESPSLYRLKLRLTAPGRQPAEIEQRIGFKQVKIVGNSYTLNGQPVKFWGACRHDADPLRGRAISKETAWRDIELMKSANLNAMRTSHYPPNPEALNAADALGLYVEDEAPFCWVDWMWLGRGRAVGNDLRLAPLAMQLASELVERDRNHPCVSIWSVCNESDYGRNLGLVQQTIKSDDPSRPQSAGQSATLDLATFHNPTSMERIRGSADLPTPVLFDEGFCIFQGFGPQADGLELDPGLRDYWVTAHFEPVKAILQSDHYLGAMIWAWVDDAFLVPGRGNEYGRKTLPHTHIVDDVYARPGRGIVGDPMWGMIDGWRRPRPEYWLAKKLFSPIHIEEQALVPTRTIAVPVENRNYFVNLSQYECRWRLGRERGKLRADVAPQQHGLIKINPRQRPGSNDVLCLEFYDPQQRLVDGYRLGFGPVSPPVWLPSGQPARITEPPGTLDFDSTICLTGDNIELAYDRTSGELDRAVAGEQQVLEQGPALHVLKNNAAYEVFPMGWRLTASSHRVENGMAVLEWNGDYGRDFTGGFTIRLDDSGHVQISYRFHYKGSEITAREIGLTFQLPLDCDTLNWNRKAEWSYYPDTEIGRPSGRATAHPARSSKIHSFAEDDHAWGCNDFRSAKRNIYWSSLTDARGAGVKIISDGTQHTRATVGPRSIALQVLDYYGGAATGTPEWDSAYGMGKTIRPGDVLEGTVRMELLKPAAAKLFTSNRAVSP